MSDAAGQSMRAGIALDAWIDVEIARVMCFGTHANIQEVRRAIYRAGWSARAPSGLAGSAEDAACENHEFAEHMSNQLSMPVKCGVCGQIVAAPRLLYSGREKVVAAARDEAPGTVDEYSPAAIKHWLLNKYARHGEIEDKIAAQMIVELQILLWNVKARAAEEAANRAALPDERCPNISNAVAVDVEVAAAIERGRYMIAHGFEVSTEGYAVLSILCAAAGRAAGPPTQAARDVLAERERQVTIEGWTPEHDDEHRAELQIAAACLCVDGTDAEVMWDDERADIWGLAAKHHGSWRRQLVIAGALILAAIERTDRRDAAGPHREPGHE